MEATHGVSTAFQAATWTDLNGHCKDSFEKPKDPYDQESRLSAFSTDMLQMRKSLGLGLEPGATGNWSASTTIESARESLARGREVEDLQASIRSIRGRLSVLEGSTLAQTTCVQKVDSVSSSLQKFREVDGRICALEALEVSRVEDMKRLAFDHTSVLSLERSLRDLDQKVDGVSRQLVQVSGESGRAQETAESAERSMRELDAKLTKQVATMIEDNDAMHDEGRSAMGENLEDFTSKFASYELKSDDMRNAICQLAMDVDLLQRRRRTSCSTDTTWHGISEQTSADDKHFTPNSRESFGKLDPSSTATLASESQSQHDSDLVRWSKIDRLLIEQEAATSQRDEETSQRLERMEQHIADLKSAHESRWQELQADRRLEQLEQKLLAEMNVVNCEASSRQADIQSVTQQCAEMKREMAKESDLLLLRSTVDDLDKILLSEMRRLGEELNQTHREHVKSMGSTLEQFSEELGQEMAQLAGKSESKYAALLASMESRLAKDLSELSSREMSHHRSAARSVQDIGQKLGLRLGSWQVRDMKLRDEVDAMEIITKNISEVELFGKEPSLLGGREESKLLQR